MATGTKFQGPERMDAVGSLTGTVRPARHAIGSLVDVFHRHAAGAALIVALVAATVLAARRWMGVLSTPLSTSSLLLCGSLLLLLALVTRRPARGRFTQRSWTAVRNGLPAIVGSVSVLAIAAAVSLPGTSAPGIVALWTMVLAGELARWEAVPAVWAGRANRTRNSQFRRFGRQSGLTDRGTYPSASDVAADDPSVRQYLIRRQVDAADVLEGWLRAAIEPGQRYATLHVAFCPPFESAPTVAVEPLDGLPATVTISNAYAHGARLEIRCERSADEPSDVTVAFYAAVNP